MGVSLLGFICSACCETPYPCQLPDMCMIEALLKALSYFQLMEKNQFVICFCGMDIQFVKCFRMDIQWLSNDIVSLASYCPLARTTLCF